MNVRKSLTSNAGLPNYSSGAKYSTRYPLLGPLMKQSADNLNKNETAGSFREKFCNKFQCDPSEFEQRLLWMTMPNTAKVVGKVVNSLNPSFFGPEHTIIDYLGNISSRSELTSEAQRIQSDYRRLGAAGFLRVKCGVRISGRRLLNICYAVW